MPYRFLPMTREEAGGDLDVILVSGDAYVDHGSFGVALVGRWLEAHGFSVGVISQPAWDSPEPFRALGRPRLFYGVTAGNMDSMVNHYTAHRRIRTDDAYSPGGKAGLRPDRASIAYANRCKQAYPGVPVVLGGIEASLRRLVHYDYWQDKVRRSILLDAKADLLCFGMAELSIVEIATRLAAGKSIKECRDIPGTAWALGMKDAIPDVPMDVVPSYEECLADPVQFGELTVRMYREANPKCGKAQLQKHGDRAIFCNAPARALTTTELDKLYELPYANAPHPCYREPVPAFEAIKGSITINRGCAGGCSFCALTLHQGKDVISRSTASVLREVKTVANQPGFNGILSDLGGPTANMFHMRCTSEAANKVCRRVSCLHPTRCKHYGTDHKPFIELLRATREVPGVRRVFINSGLRYDLTALDDEIVEEIATHHTSGTLTTAPEHASPAVLKAMRKPELVHLDGFVKRFKDASEKAGKNQFLVPYFQCAHPGCGPDEAIELGLFLKKSGLKVRQVQTFIPTPGTISTAMWVSGVDPYGRKPIYVARGHKERARQRALMFWWKREEHAAIREALVAWGRQELIGTGPECLVPPGPAKGSWIKGNRPVEPTVGAMGAVVERASAQDIDEERWEGQAGAAC